MLHACRTFAAEPSSPGRVRRFVRRALAADVPADRLETAVLLASELASNAVLHARTDFEVRITVTPRILRLALSDESSRPPLPVNVDADATSGRGLRLLEGLASRWGSEAHPAGKSVWFELTIQDATIIDLARVKAALGPEVRASGRTPARRRVRS